MLLTALLAFLLLPFTNPTSNTMSEHTSVIVMGASGDLAFKKTFPALFNLFKNDLLPPSVELIGYARTKMGLEDFRTRVTSQIKLKKPGDETYVGKFKELLTYVDGQYDQEDVGRDRACEVYSAERDPRSVDEPVYRRG